MADVPADCIAAVNPCRFIKSVFLNERPADTRARIEVKKYSRPHRKSRQYA